MRPNSNPKLSANSFQDTVKRGTGKGYAESLF